MIHNKYQKYRQTKHQKAKEHSEKLKEMHFIKFKIHQQ